MDIDTLLLKHLSADQIAFIREQYKLRTTNDGTTAEFDSYFYQVVQRVTNYCVRVDIPIELTMAVVDILCELLPKGTTTSVNTSKEVKRVSIGGATVEYTSAATATKAIDELILSAGIDLERWRKPGLFI